MPSPIGLNDRPLSAGRGLRSPRALIAGGAWPALGIPVDGCHLGAAIALRLCYVALGGVDGVYEGDVSLTDIAGAAPIVMEAGGVLTVDRSSPVGPPPLDPRASRSWPAIQPSIARSPTLYRAVILL